MNLNEDRKAPLRGKDLSTKREMVVQYISATAKSVSEVMFFLSLMFSVVGQVVVDDVSFNSSPTFFILPFIPRWCHSLFHPHVFMLESQNFDLFPVFVYFSYLLTQTKGPPKINLSLLSRWMVSTLHENCVVRLFICARCLPAGSGLSVCLVVRRVWGARQRDNDFRQFSV